VKAVNDAKRKQLEEKIAVLPPHKRQRADQLLNYLALFPSEGVKLDWGPRVQTTSPRVQTTSGVHPAKIKAQGILDQLNQGLTTPPASYPRSPHVDQFADTQADACAETQVPTETELAASLKQQKLIAEASRAASAVKPQVAVAAVEVPQGNSASLGGTPPLTGSPSVLQPVPQPILKQPPPSGSPSVLQPVPQPILKQPEPELILESPVDRPVAFAPQPPELPKEQTAAAPPAQTQAQQHAQAAIAAVHAAEERKLAEAQAKAQAAEAAKKPANSVSHMAAWKRFDRLLNVKRFDQSTLDWVANDKQNLFQVFMDCKEDKEMCVQLITKRKQLKENFTTDKVQWKKFHWIRDKLYNGNEKKAKAACKQIADQGGVMADKYLPDDEEETYYLIEVYGGTRFKNTILVRYATLQAGEQEPLDMWGTQL